MPAFLLLWLQRPHSRLVHQESNLKNILAKAAIALSLAITIVTNSVLAEEECRDPIAEWQPREVLKRLLEELGWVVHRIRIDDGCYQVRALDDQGRRVEATYAPASLKLLEFELEDDEHERRERHESQQQSH